jgi:toxin ParE1/3/4
MSDIADLLDWSERNFGPAAQRRYRELVDQAIRDIAEDPMRARSSERPELGTDARSWHLRNSRHRVSGDKVGRPRHFAIYRATDGVVVFGRFLHERMELALHVDDQAWEI